MQRLPILITESQTSIAMCDSEDISSTCTITYLSDEEESDSDDISLCDLLLQMQSTNEHITISKNGYKYLHTISDTLQGELFKAIVTSSSKNPPIGSYVAIKKSEKSLLENGIAIQDDMNFVVEENLIKEASILKQLTQLNGNKNIVKYIDYFESNEYVYLVMEYIENAITLKEFICMSHQSIHNGKLTLKQYSKTIKCLMYQLATTIEWLHNTAHCHLDLCVSNIMIENYEYNKDKHGYLTSNDCIKLRLCDFGVSEHFDAPNNVNDIRFLCQKILLTLENAHLLAPEIQKIGTYDGRFADMWSIGLILYNCMVGKPLYNPCNLWDEPKGGYLALKTNKLREYLIVHRKLKYFKGSCFSLLSNLLAFESNKRMHASDVVKHRWFYAQNLKV